jgi:hypothetical protein
LNGFVETSAGTGQLATEWKVNSGPGAAQWSDASQTNCTVSFDAAGEYVLMLKASDGIHTPSYDTVRVRVTDGLSVSIRREGNSVRLMWTGGEGNYTVEATGELGTEWSTIVEVTGTEYLVPVSDGQRFFRVRQ